MFFSVQMRANYEEPDSHQDPVYTEEDEGIVAEHVRKHYDTEYAYADLAKPPQDVERELKQAERAAAVAVAS